MPNISLFFYWVKNVYKQRTVRWKKSEALSTQLKKDTNHVLSYVGKVLFIHGNILTLFTILSTFKNNFSSLLEGSFPHFPQDLLLQPLNEI